MTADFDDDDATDNEDDFDMSLSDESLDDLIDDDDLLEEGDDSLPSDPKERAARSLEIRRAIEARLEARRMERDLDYLDLDDDLDDL